MKFHETHFEEYIHTVQSYNLHPKLESIFAKFPSSLDKLRNMIFFGPSGVGKYSQMLYAIKRYSPTDLKYEKKITIVYEKDKTYSFKMSDIHYEIDMALLGCNSKVLWHEIFIQINDILSVKNNKIGIIVCKNFHHIHSELLDIFYSYMQENNSNSINIKFIIITEVVSFIPDAIMNCCEMIHIPRPSKTAYNNCLKFHNKKLPKNMELTNIINIKNLYHLHNFSLPHKHICDKIIKQLTNIEEIHFVKFRNILYDILSYNLDITHCIWYILTKLIESKHINSSNLSNILLKTYSFLKYYNNNYRPIYHLESYFYSLSLFILSPSSC